MANTVAASRQSVRRPPVQVAAYSFRLGYNVRGIFQSACHRRSALTAGRCLKLPVRGTGFFRVFQMMKTADRNTPGKGLFHLYTGSHRPSDHRLAPRQQTGGTFLPFCNWKRSSMTDLGNSISSFTHRRGNMRCLKHRCHACFQPAENSTLSKSKIISGFHIACLQRTIRQRYTRRIR